MECLVHDNHRLKSEIQIFMRPTRDLYYIRTYTFMVCSGLETKIK